MTFGAADERAHSPGESSWWWETWHLDAATEDGVGVAVRLGCAPALGVAWWWTHVLLPGLPGPIVVRDHEVGLPRQGLEVRADGLWGELFCEAPFDHWTYGLEAFGVKLDDPADSLRGEIGERMPVGLDIEWEAEPAGRTAHEYRPDGEIRGYEQFGVVHGELLLDRTRLELDAVGLRSHTWGVPRTDRPACSLWLHSAARSLSFAVSGDDDVDGYIVHNGAIEPISSVRTETRLRADGLPVATRHIIDDDLELDVEVLGLSAVPLAGPDGERATLARALCAEGAEIGWSSRLAPE
jgi:hypothetical protein